MINEGRIVPFQASELPVTKGPWLVFAPHADDESFGMGGTLAKASEKGIRSTVVVMTDGALGGKQADLVEIRQQEASKAAALLGLDPPVFLENEDRGLTEDEKTLQQIVDQIARIKPAAVFFPGVFELHPDHRMTAALVWRALGSLDLPDTIPVSYEVLIQSPVNTLVDITAYIVRKKEAMAAYNSQLDENRYEEFAQALNRLRALTLPPETVYAEGFHCFDAADLQFNLLEVISTKIALLFEL